MTAPPEGVDGAAERSLRQAPDRFAARPGTGEDLPLHRRRRDAAMRREIEQSLRAAGWNLSAAARDLGMTRSGLWRAVKSLGIARPERPDRLRPAFAIVAGRLAPGEVDLASIVERPAGSFTVHLPGERPDDQRLLVPLPELHRYAPQGYFTASLYLDLNPADGKRAGFVIQGLEIDLEHRGTGRLSTARGFVKMVKTLLAAEGAAFWTREPWAPWETVNRSLVGTPAWMRRVVGRARQLAGLVDEFEGTAGWESIRGELGQAVEALDRAIQGEPDPAPRSPFADEW